MALSPDASKLGRLRAIAGMLRDRDLGAVADLLRRVRQVERQIQDLEQHEARLLASLAAAPNPQDMMQMQSYGRLVGQQVARLTAERDAHAAEAEASLIVARRSFARAQVADTLSATVERERRAKRWRGLAD